MGSLWPLVRDHAVCAKRCCCRCSSSAAFNAFWATLPTLLEGEPYHLGSAIAGAFGIIGAVGALAAAFAGRLSDNLGPRRVAALAAADRARLLRHPACSVNGGSVALVIGVATMDAGAQASLVSNQTRSFALNPLAQNRINTLYTSSMFLGGALGSAGSTMVWVWGGMERRDGLLRHPLCPCLRHRPAKETGLGLLRPGRYPRPRSVARALRCAGVCANGTTVAPAGRNLCR